MAASCTSTRCAVPQLAAAVPQGLQLKEVCGAAIWLVWLLWHVVQCADSRPWTAAAMTICNPNLNLSSCDHLNLGCRDHLALLLLLFFRCWSCWLALAWRCPLRATMRWRSCCGMRWGCPRARRCHEEHGSASWCRYVGLAEAAVRGLQLALHGLMRPRMWQRRMSLSSCCRPGQTEASSIVRKAP